METPSYYVAEKPLFHKEGFTLIEFLLVLTIISLTLFLTVTNQQSLIPTFDLETQVAKLTSEIDYYQSLAIKHKQPVLLVFRPYHNDIKIQIGNEKPFYDSLSPLILLNSSNLDYIQFNTHGHNTKFGTLKFLYHQQKFKLIFHIEQGRYRVSLEN